MATSDALTSSLPRGTISAGGFHTCALVTLGTVKCWGDNDRGQLGDGGTAASSSPVTVTGIRGATQIASGTYHTCALMANGSVKCWGWNLLGQLGLRGGGSRSTPVTVSGIGGATQISAGGDHTCALGTGGGVTCWGGNESGQLGDQEPRQVQSDAVAVLGISGATQVSAGRNHTCALLGDASVACWGNNFSGQLGDGTRTTRPVTGAVIGISDAVEISAGDTHTCALVAGGRVKCWGDQLDGALGAGTKALTAVDVTGISDAQEISAGGYHSCARMATGSVKCWGWNLYGQLGDGTSLITHSTPVTVSGISDARQISAGYAHTCAVVAVSRVVCWGNNADGQLGDGTNTHRKTPVTVTGLSVLDAPQKVIVCSDGPLHNQCSEFDADDNWFGDDVVGNDTASWISVPAGTRVALFADADWLGACNDYGAGTFDVGPPVENDQASSIRVGQGCPAVDPGGPAPPPPSTNPPTADPVCPQPPLGRAPTGEYAYYKDWNLGKWDAGIAATAMNIIQETPNRVFPFKVEGFNGETSLMLGHSYALWTFTPRPVLNPRLKVEFRFGPDPVTVTRLTPTSFTFLALPGHVEQGTITFTTCVDANGDLRLSQDARGPETLWGNRYFRDLAANRFWSIMKTKLLSALIADRPSDEVKRWAVDSYARHGPPPG